MLDEEPVDGFDLPDDCEADQVRIYRQERGDLPYVAVPYVHRETFDDGTDWYHEPTDFSPTDRFREAVASRADLPTDQIDMEHTIPTYDATV